MAYPACIINGAAVTKTFQILYRNEEVRLDDVINFRIHALVEAGKVNIYNSLFVDSKSDSFNQQRAPKSDRVLQSNLNTKVVGTFYYVPVPVWQNGQFKADQRV